MGNTESTPKRRRYASPPPPSSPIKIMYGIKRKLTEKEKANQLTTSPHMPMKFDFNNNKEINFGRDPQKNEFVLDSNRTLITSKGKNIGNNALVSRQHGKFIFKFNQWHIFDKKSTNGIIINGKQIPPNSLHPLHENDVIVFGKYKNFTDTEFQYIFTERSLKNEPLCPRTPSPQKIVKHLTRPSQVSLTPRIERTESPESQQSENQFSLD